jgi:hypothetical protein
MKSLILAASMLCSCGIANGAITVYLATLSGAAESPANASAGTGIAYVTINDVANTMRLDVTFSGLTGTVTAAHIHAATAVAGAGTAGVATTTPTFPGFPSGVTSGSYDSTFDMTLSSSYNSAYLTANGGTTATAWSALQTAIGDGKAYLNIHTSSFGGGEIRGFMAIPEPAATSMLGLTGLVFAFGRRRK